MPGIAKLGRVMIPVSSQDDAIAFYTSKLGFTLAADVRSATASGGSRSRRRTAERGSRSCRRAASTSRGGTRASR